MNHNQIARVIAIVFLSILFAAYIDLDHQKWPRVGREQFLAHEAERFDRGISGVHPSGALVIGGVIVVGLFVGFNEILVWAFSSVLKSMGPRPQTQTDNRGTPFG